MPSYECQQSARRRWGFSDLVDTDTTLQEGELIIEAAVHHNVTNWQWLA